MDLLVATDPRWLKVVMSDIDSFLLDHANCERKASALAMSLVVKYPDRHGVVAGLIDLAREELDHFGQLYQVLRGRGLTPAKDVPDPYINQLLDQARHGRDERFIDRMLISSVVECRGAERFGLLAEGLPDAGLRSLYRDLWKSEIKHGHQFVQLLLTECDESVVYPRLHELLEKEASIVRGLKLRPALH